MNATSLNALRNATASSTGDLGDERMEQIRELLLGDQMRHSETRLAAIESRLHALETDLGHKFDAIQARIEALAGETQGEQRAAFDELARSIEELGDRVRTITRT